MRDHTYQINARRPVNLAHSVPDLTTPIEQDNQPAIFDEQFGIRLGGRSYYINLRIGSELRTGRRLAAEGQVHVSGVAFLYCVICSGAIMMFGTLCLLYLLKSGLGLDFSDHDSILHPLFEMMIGD